MTNGSLLGSPTLIPDEAALGGNARRTEGLAGNEVPTMQDPIDCPSCELRARLAALVEHHQHEDDRGPLDGSALLAELLDREGGERS